MQEFYKRFFFKTYELLNKLIEENVTLTKEELNNLSLFHMKDYYSIIRKYDCLHFKEDTLVFCECYNQYQLFIRNRALQINHKISKIENSSKLDEFGLYLQGLITNNSKTFKKIIEKNEKFYEAYEFIEEVPAVKSELGKKILLLYKLRKGLIGESEKIDLEIQKRFPNFLGAHFYFHKNYEKSIFYFEKSFSFDFLDLYSNALYILKSKKVSTIAFKAYKENKFRPETHIAVANHYSMKKDHFLAIKHFLNAIKLDQKYSVCYTLIGNEYMEMNNNQEAIKYYTLSIQTNRDFRAWFGLGQAYSILMLYEYSIVFFKMCINLQPKESYLWLTLGHSYSKINNDECSKCYLKAFSLGDTEALIYVADYFKSQKKFSEAIKFYEKYVNMEGKESKRVTEFLVEYYSRIGNKKKHSVYKDKLKEM